MATAEDLRNEMTAFMREQGIKYTIQNEEDNILRLSFAATSSKQGGGAHTEVLVDFDEDGDEADSVHFVAYRFASCSMDNFAEVVLKLNEANARYRWVKFYVLPGDGDRAYLSADSDATLVPGASALECVGSCFRMSDIVEDVIVSLGDLIDGGDEQSEMRRMLEALKQMLGE